MPIKLISFFTLLLIYLSGNFAISIFFQGQTVEIRFILIIAFLYLVVAGLSVGKRTWLPHLKKGVFNIIIILVLYVFFVTISMIYTPDAIFALDKFISTIFLLLLVFATIVMASMLNPKQFYQWISFFFIFVGGIYTIPVVSDVISGSARGDVGFSGPNVATRIFFFAACSSLFLYATKKSNFYFLLSMVFFGSIVMVGSRGGLIGALLVLSYMFIAKKVSASWKFKKSVKIEPRKLLLIPFGILIVYFLYEPVKAVFFQRFLGVTFQNTGGVYTSGRDIIYRNSIEMIKEKPLFGHGLESFTVKTGTVYPHNLLLEMALETGLMGIFIFIAFLIIAFRVVFKMKRSSTFIFSGLPLYMIIVQMFSGEFYDFRYFFLWLIPILHYGAVTEVAMKVSKDAKRNKVAQCNSLYM